MERTLQMGLNCAGWLLFPLWLSNLIRITGQLEWWLRCSVASHIPTTTLVSYGASSYSWRISHWNCRSPLKKKQGNLEKGPFVKQASIVYVQSFLYKVLKEKKCSVAAAGATKCLEAAPGHCILATSGYWIRAMVRVYQQMMEKKTQTLEKTVCGGKRGTLRPLLPWDVSFLLCVEAFPWNGDGCFSFSYILFWYCFTVVACCRNYGVDFF